VANNKAMQKAAASVKPVPVATPLSTAAKAIKGRPLTVASTMVAAALAYDSTRSQAQAAGMSSTRANANALGAAATVISATAVIGAGAAKVTSVVAKAAAPVVGEMSLMAAAKLGVRVGLRGVPIAGWVMTGKEVIDLVPNTPINIDQYAPLPAMPERLRDAVNTSFEVSMAVRATNALLSTPARVQNFLQSKSPALVGRGQRSPSAAAIMPSDISRARAMQSSKVPVSIPKPASNGMVKAHFRMESSGKRTLVQAYRRAA
jgi:hypothetical protein